MRRGLARLVATATARGFTIEAVEIGNHDLAAATIGHAVVLVQEKHEMLLVQPDKRRFMQLFIEPEYLPAFALYPGGEILLRRLTRKIDKRQLRLRPSGDRGNEISATVRHHHPHGVMPVHEPRECLSEGSDIEPLPDVQARDHVVDGDLGMQPPFDPHQGLRGRERHAGERIGASHGRCDVRD